MVLGVAPRIGPLGTPTGTRRSGQTHVSSQFEAVRSRTRGKKWAKGRGSRAPASRRTTLGLPLPCECDVESHRRHAATGLAYCCCRSGICFCALLARCARLFPRASPCLLSSRRWLSRWIQATRCCWCSGADGQGRPRRAVSLGVALTDLETRGLRP